MPPFTDCLQLPFTSPVSLNEYLVIEKELKGGSQEKKGAFEKKLLRSIQRFIQL